MTFVFHAKILARFQFGWFWLRPSAQYMMSKIQFLWFSEAHRHFILHSFDMKFFKWPNFMKTKVPVTGSAIFMKPPGSLKHLSINTHLVLSDSGATLKFQFCMLKNTSHTDFQLKFSIPGILAAIISSGKKLWKYITSVIGFQKFFCVVDWHEKTDFWLQQLFWLRPFFDPSDLKK